MDAQRLPDFIIIGAMKSATTSLQEQLELQSGIFMCDPKEPNFFGDDRNYERGLAWYAALFSGAKVGDLVGEASTEYTKLPTYPHAVARLRKDLPGVRLVYVMRHPVDRLVSHYIHEWSLNNVKCGLDEAVARHPELIAYGKYAFQLEPFLDAFGTASILPVFFDRLVQSPQSELERVAKFIGYRGTPRWQVEHRPSNVSSERVRKFPLYGALIQSGAATWLRRTLVPKAWRDWVKSRLTMKARPLLSEQRRLEVEQVFNRDLAVLGKWLGTPLNCENFKEATATRELNWVAGRA